MDFLVLWIVVTIVAIVVDIATSSFLFVWFGLGGIAAIIAEVCGISEIWQVAIFIGVSLLATAIGYPWAKKKFKKIKRTPLMEEDYIGKEFVAKEQIKETAQIKVGGIYWTGKNEGNVINKGEKFKIVSIDGNKFIIKGLKEEK
ncbi:MAG: NfeD family protein [Clostridiaceae bacterium]|nr:NfeD family protein [Clostridiaceae bacterium]